MEVRNLSKHFATGRRLIARGGPAIRAVEDVSFNLAAGQCLGLVGESGCGKTTVGRTILRALEPTAGQIRLRIDGRTLDLAPLTQGQLRPLRRHMQMIFQDPYASLNPRMTVFDIIGEPLLVHGVRRRQRRQLVGELLVQVGLAPHHLQRYPHAFSGGQRQRIGIARALALRPELIVADEPVSALDVSVQAQILNLLADLRRQLGLTYLFIAHDLSVVRHICDPVAVMYFGRLVEVGPTGQLFARPLHPYTEALLSAAPAPDPARRRQRIVLRGEVADSANAPSGCPFHPRCRYAQPRCAAELPQLRAVLPARQARCHFAETLDLQGSPLG